MTYNANKISIYSILLLLNFVSLLSCKDEEKFIPLKIFSIHPQEALIGDTIIIKGEGFSPDPRVNGIFFPGASRIEPFKKTNSELWAILPDKSLSGPITVNILDEETYASPVLTIKAPVITSISPTEAWLGDTLQITGENFRPVAFENRIYFKPGSDTPSIIVGGKNGTINAIVPQLTSKCNVNIFGFDGPSFTPKKPEINSISPTQGKAGDLITVYGKGLPLNGNANIGTAGALIQTGSTNRAAIIMIPDNAADGVVKLSNGDGYSATSVDILKIYPGIKNIVPLSGYEGIPVTITGTGFSPVILENKVFFNGKEANVTKASKTEIIAIVPTGFTPGPVSVVVNDRAVEGANFTLSPPGSPIVLSVNPSSGPVGSEVIINGINFDASIQNNSVKIGTVDVTVLNGNTEQLTIKIPSNAKTGIVTVSKNGMTGIGPEFQVTTSQASPFIATINPEQASRGETITINGGNFGTVKENVIVNTTSANSLQVISVSDQEVKVSIPSSFPAGSHQVQVSVAGRTSLSSELFVNSNPQITDLSIKEGFAGSILTITGSDFSAIETDNIVKFNETKATYTNTADALLTIGIYVPDVTPGIYKVSVTVGNKSNTFDFTVHKKPDAVKNIYIAALTTGSGGQSYKVIKSTFDPPSTFVAYDAQSTGGNIVAIAADFLNSKLYMYNGTVIARSNLDNSGYDELYTESESGSVEDFTIDGKDNEIFWTTTEANVYKGSADGTTTPEKLLSVDNGNVGYIVYGISYNEDDDMLYLIEYDAINFTPGISKIKADGSGNTTPLFNSEDGLVDPRDIRVDTKHNTAFIIDGMETIYIGSADGTGALKTFLTITPGTVLLGMALDLQDSYLYWAEFDNASTTSVYRKRYDGEIIEGTQPPSNVQKVYSIQGSFSVKMAQTGLVIEESTHQGGSQRARFSSMTLKTLNRKRHH